MVSNEDLIYMAGIVDGEGTIGLTTNISVAKLHGPRYKEGTRGKEYSKYKRIVAFVSIGMTDKTTVERFYILFGGTLCPRPANNKHKDYWVWRVSNNKALAVAEALLPYLRIKRNQAELLITFQKDRGQSRRCSPILKEADEILLSMSHKLNGSST